MARKNSLSQTNVWLLLLILINREISKPDSALKVDFENNWAESCSHAGEGDFC